LITLIYAGWLPHDLASSRSCLALKSEVRPKPYSHRLIEGSPERDRAPGSVLGMFGLWCHASFLPVAVVIGRLFCCYMSRRIGNRPHEGGKLTGGGSDHGIFVLSMAKQLVESTAQSDLRLPGNLSDLGRQTLHSRQQSPALPRGMTVGMGGFSESPSHMTITGLGNATPANQSLAPEVRKIRT